MNNSIISTQGLLIVIITLLVMAVFFSMSNCHLEPLCNCKRFRENFNGWSIMDNTSYKPLNLTHDKIIEQPRQMRLGVCEYLCRNDPNCTGFFHTTRGSIIDGGRMFPLRSCVRLNGPLDVTDSSMVADTYMKK